MTSVSDLNTLDEQPAHLQEAGAKAKERIEKQLAQEPEDKAAKAEAEDPKGKESYTFTLKHRDNRGKMWRGTFTNKVLTIREQQGVALRLSEYHLGRPWGSIEPDTSALNSFLAHMEFSLKAHEDAGWARDKDGGLELRDLHDPAVILALWEEVDSHESTFLGRRPAEAGSKKDG